MKYCDGCERTLEKSKFGKDKKRWDGKRPVCKECAKASVKKYTEKNKDKIREAHLKKNYGIDTKEYERMLSDQNEVCAICGQKSKNGPLRVDHNHSTGEIRGLLCNGCNLAIGQFGDDSSLMRKAAEYIDRTESP